MSARTTVRAMVLLAGALVVAACGGGTPTAAPGITQAPATVAPATVAPATQAPVTQAPAATDGVPTFAMPSFHGDVDLEEMIPAEIGGETIETLSMTGEQFLGTGADSEITAALATLNRQPSDLSVAFGGNSLITILAFQVDGVAGSAILDAFKASSEDGATVTQVSFGGKSVQKIMPGSSSDETNYVYAVNDVVFTVGGRDVTDELLNEVFSKLP